MFGGRETEAMMRWSIGIVEWIRYGEATMVAGRR